MEYFQDDIFPDTAVTWKPTLTAAEWLMGTNRIPETVSLKPPGMKPCKLIGLGPGERQVKENI